MTPLKRIEHMNSLLEYTDAPVLLADIQPKRNPAYSPNLYLWMRKRGHARPHIRLFNQKSTGHLYLGFGDSESWFYGSMLNRVLCYGSKAETFAHPKGSAFEHIPGFWEEYTRLGRCAIDKEHRMYFMDRRWNVDGDSRTCLWCGHKQIRKEKTITQVKEYWT